MIDISAMQTKYGLSDTDFQLVKGQYDNKNTTEKASFSETDFVNLLKNSGWQVNYLYGDQNQPILRAPAMHGTFSLDKLNFLEGGATPGAAVMALLTKGAAEQRKINKEIIYEQSKAIQADIKEQASEMKSKAWMQLALGIVSGTLSIASGFYSSYNSAKMDTSLGSNEFQQINTDIGGKSQGIKGAGDIFTSLSTFVGTGVDAKIKEIDADIEDRRASMENLKALNESFHELIQKSQSTATSLVESAAQARNKIMG